NFVVIKVGVEGIPPLFLASLRFAFSVFPAIFLVKKPEASFGSLAAYGLLLGVGEFGLLFTAIKLGAPPGLCSVLLQSQAFFTAIFGAVFMKEKLGPHNIAGMGIAGAGLLLFGLASASGSADSAGFSPVLVAMVLAAAASWAGANVVARAMPRTGGFGLMVWSSLFSPLPLAGLSLVIEGPGAIARSLSAIQPITVGALAYLVVLSTLVGYGLWNALIMRHGAGKIAPFSLMVPVFALVFSILFLKESFGLAEGAASLLVLIGLLVHVFGSRVWASRGAIR
ncbi:MAG: EamA family transporter, partial [Spirochaetaceae bacterium]|nr:EamA family transporter [Spirochaetaceae bacterium]